MTGQLSQYGGPAQKVIDEVHSSGSSVFVMIETKSSIEKIDEIAATPEVDVLLISSNDLAIELGVAGEFESKEYRSAVTKVSEAASRNRKVFGFKESMTDLLFTTGCLTSSVLDSF
jgi:2-keto-3-deoxy-L-rhamnonate aldolase RhmA